MTLLDKLQGKDIKLISGKDADEHKSIVAQAINDCIEEDGGITCREVYNTLYEVLNLEQTFQNMEKIFGKYISKNGNPYIRFKFGIKNIRIHEAILSLMEKNNTGDRVRVKLKISGLDSRKEKAVYYKTEEGLKKYLSQRLKRLQPLLILNYEFSRSPKA